MKAERNLTVYEMSGYHYKPTPTIMLKGQWLAEIGFEAGNRIKVCCENGRITILPLEEDSQNRKDAVSTTRIRRR